MRDINLVCAQQRATKEAGETKTFHYKKQTVSKCTSLIVKRLEDQILGRPRKKQNLRATYCQVMWKFKGCSKSIR
jgi:hypothetical protein